MNLKYRFNANYHKGRNFPGVDLIDLERRIGIQVTSTPTNAKVLSTLNQSIKHYEESNINSLQIYILSRKLPSRKYVQKQKLFDEVLGGKIKFDAEIDILLQEFLNNFLSGGNFKIINSESSLKPSYNKLNFKSLSYSKFLRRLETYLIYKHSSSQSNNTNYAIQKGSKSAIMKFCKEGSKRPVIKKTIHEILQVV